MPRGSLYDRTVLWRAREGIRRCQRGGLFLIVRQSVASSCSPGGSIKVFIDAPGGLFDRMAVRCQLCVSDRLN
jgi:hypothetical protein